MEEENTKCRLCWRLLETWEANSEGVHSAKIPFSQEHLLNCKKYLKIELPEIFHGENKFFANNFSLCKVCIDSLERLCALNCQLQEIEKELDNFADSFSKMLKKFRNRTEETSIGPSEQDILDLDSEYNRKQNNLYKKLESITCENDSTNTGEVAHCLQNSTETVGAFNIKKENDDTYCEDIQENFSFQNANTFLTSRPMKEVRVKLKRLKFKLRGQMPPLEHNTTVFIVEGTGHSNENSLPRNKIFGEQIDDIDMDDENEDFYSSERNSEGQITNCSGSGRNSYTISYCCSRCHKSSPDLGCMENHIRMHEKRDSEYWLKNLKYLKKVKSLRREIYT